ncbi:unnamed protein product [Ixodes pacificus]
MGFWNLSVMLIKMSAWCTSPMRTSVVPLQATFRMEGSPVLGLECSPHLMVKEKSTTCPVLMEMWQKRLCLMDEGHMMSGSIPVNSSSLDRLEAQFSFSLDTTLFVRVTGFPISSWTSNPAHPQQWVHPVMVSPATQERSRPFSSSISSPSSPVQQR